MPSLASVTSAFYSSPKANCVFLSFLCALSWSFLDLMQGTLIDVDANVIVIGYGVGLTIAGIIGVVLDPGGVAAPLQSWKNSAAVIVFGVSAIADSITYVAGQKFVPLGDVALFFYLSVVYTSFMDSLWRRRLPTASQSLGLILCAVGVTLVTQPSFIFRSASSSPAEFRDGSAFGYLLAFLSGVFVAGGNMIVAVFEDVRSPAWTISAGLCDIIYGSSALAIVGNFGIDPTPILKVALVSAMLLDTIGRLGNLIANKSHSPTLMVLVSVSQIPLTYTWGWIWLGQSLNSLKIAGVFVVVAAVVIVVVGNSGDVRRESGERDEEEKPLKDSREE